MLTQMLTSNVAGFLRKAKEDSILAEQVRKADTYQALVNLSKTVGESATSTELRGAFAARGAGVLAQQMIRTGLIDPLPLVPVPPMDQELWNRVAALDLSAVVSQLVNYQGWTAERAASVEQRYRRFFYLKASLPDGMASPSAEIDEFWHQHIINTRQYGSDCWRVAGRFLHHTFLSPTDPEQAREIQTVWLATWICYETLFEEPYEETIGTALLERWPNV
jgi:hypothetical protein